MGSDCALATAPVEGIAAVVAPTRNSNIVVIFTQVLMEALSYPFSYSGLQSKARTYLATVMWCDLETRKGVLTRG